MPVEGDSGCGDGVGVAVPGVRGNVNFTPILWNRVICRVGITGNNIEERSDSETCPPMVSFFNRQN
jgi:hypothetical protein